MELTVDEVMANWKPRENTSWEEERMRIPGQYVHDMARSLRKRGQRSPIILDVDGTVQDGRVRVLAAQEAGLKRLDCIDLSTPIEF